MKILDDLKYSTDHEWLKVDGDIATIGITDYAQDSLGEVVYVEFPEIDDELEAGSVFGTIESVKAAADSYIPISGQVVEINETLEDSPELINETPFDAWIIKVQIKDMSELDSLMDAKKYKEFCEEE